MKLLRRRRSSDGAPSPAQERPDEPVATERVDDPLGEIDALMRQNRERRDPETERRLLLIRHQAFEELRDAPAGTAAEPGADAGGNAQMAQGLPTLAPRDLTPEALRAAILSRGCLYVPELISRARAEGLAAGIDRAFDAYDASGGNGAAQADGWFEPFTLPGQDFSRGRGWDRDAGAVWAADSPRLMFELLDSFERRGLRELIERYLGQRPAVSVNKSVLRRVPPGSNQLADWHQDGAFLGGARIRSLNVWLALSDCGRDAPGMDVLPQRLDHVVEPGTDGAIFDWSISNATVERVGGEGAAVRPEFRAGDVLFFDHLFLHRTASEPEMTRTRYAIETWFFSPSTYPDKLVPLVF